MHLKSSDCFAAALCALLALQTPTLAQGTEAVRDHRGAGTTIRDHRVEPTVRDHRTQRKNEVVPITKLDCRVGYEKLRRSGYDDVVVNTCQVPQYTYTARMGTGIYRAQMHAYSGTITTTYLGIADPN